jgi:hypothetical protein
MSRCRSHPARQRDDKSLSERSETAEQQAKNASAVSQCLARSQAALVMTALERTVSGEKVLTTALAGDYTDWRELPYCATVVLENPLWRGQGCTTEAVARARSCSTHSATRRRTGRYLARVQRDPTPRRAALDCSSVRGCPGHAALAPW